MIVDAKQPHDDVTVKTILNEENKSTNDNNILLSNKILCCTQLWSSESIYYMTHRVFRLCINNTFALPEYFVV